MILDALMEFSLAQALAGTAAQNSANVFNAGTPKKLFAGGPGTSKIAVIVTAAGGTTPTLEAKFVGADDAGLSTNVVVLADTGTSAPLSTVAPPPGIPVAEYQLRPALQTVPKQYYGLIYVQTGTSPTATVHAHVVQAAQENNLS